ncbi:MAG TPA: DUF2339 domain-containing protein [Usitatibacter sp.]|nr:DUF2339 domain-containing protein [Usitatibacter sp.]
MVWLFTIGGALLGAVLGKSFATFLAFGFIGWVVGMIVKALRSPSTPPAAVPRPVAEMSFEGLVRRVAALEERLSKLERGVAPVSMETVTPVKTGAQPEPITEPELESLRISAGLPPARERQKEPVAPPTSPLSPPSPPLPPPPPPPPREPPKPNFIVAWFTGGNTIVRVGLVILFFGLAFLVKYGVEHQLVPVELRVAAVAAAGIALLVIGWWLRERRPEYALSLQGAGVAVLYLVVFGSLRLYHLLPASAAFFLLTLIAIFSAVLAIGQNSLALAVFGAAGGFLAPILASTGQGSHVMLFSYYAVLNAAICAIAWFRAWRVLNVLGFLFTFGIGLLWGVRSYRPELFDSTEPFLVGFWLMYVAIAILFARQQVAAHKSYVEGIIVFGVPIAAFGLQAGLMHHSEYTEFGLAFSSVAAGAVYLVLSAILRRAGERWILLAESFLALGMVFVSLAIPLALDARWTSAAWALEGAMVVWVGTRQDRRLMRAFGMLLQLLAGIAFIKAWPNLEAGPPLADAAFVGMALVSLAGLFTHRMLTGSARQGSWEEILGPAYFLWGMVWWVAAGVYEINQFVDAEYQLYAGILFATFTTLAFAILARREHWEAARWPELVFAPVLFLFAAASFFTQAHPFEFLGWMAWPLAFAVHFALLRYDEPSIPAAWLPWPHAIGAIVIAMLGAMELEWLANEYTAPGTAWALSARIVAPAVVVLLVSSRLFDARWPVGPNDRAYRLGAAFPLVIAMAVWSLHINFAHAGGSEPLPYLPILNAIDLGHLLGIFAVVAWWLSLRRSGIETPPLVEGRMGLAAAGIVLFIWLNAILLRSMHHWTGVAYNPNALMGSREVQAALSVFWAALALATMLIATRQGRRTLWVIGASLMGVVVVKLVLVDLSRLAGLERIISFIGVGVLMLVIGYFSPVPPREKEGG